MFFYVQFAWFTPRFTQAVIVNKCLVLSIHCRGLYRIGYRLSECMSFSRLYLSSYSPMIRSMSFLSSGIWRTTKPHRNSVSTLSYPCIIRFRVLITSFAFGISNEGSFFLMRLIASPIISVLRSTTHLRIMSFSNKSNLLGKSTKQLSKSLIASNTSCKCFKIYSSPINHLFCTVYVGDEVFVTQPFSNY